MTKVSTKFEVCVHPLRR